MDRKQLQVEVAKCRKSVAYFIRTYCFVEDPAAKEWIPFDLWPKQESTLATIHESKLTIILKARQLGLSWLVLGYALWTLLFQPNSSVLLFSRRDDEATSLLKDRLLEMYKRLPEWMRTTKVLKSNDHELRLSNGSWVKAFPTGTGDSYSASIAIIDEADLVPDLDKQLRSVKPTIDAPGNKLILLSRPDKSRPDSPFKRIYGASKRGENSYTPVFLPWDARPDRDAAWYEDQRKDSLSRTGALDDLHEQYAATEAEALAARTQDKRVPGIFLADCYVDQKPLDDPTIPVIPGLKVFALPEPGRRYVIGADVAEGGASGDNSALEILDCDSGEEVASFAIKAEPSTFAGYIDQIGCYFNKARVLVERNNHGHAVLLWLRDNSSLIRICGRDGKSGYLTNSPGKAALYVGVVEVLQTKDCVLHDFSTFGELGSIEVSNLSAPSGQHDDRAVAFCLAVQARNRAPGGGDHPIVTPVQPVVRSLFSTPEPAWDVRSSDSSLRIELPTRSLFAR